MTLDTPSAKQATPAQLRRLLTYLIKAGMPTMVTGAPGCGKTEIAHLAAQDINYDMLLTYASNCDPTDPKGLPMARPGDDFASFLPFGDAQRVLTAKTPLLWFFDDFGQAADAVQAAFMNVFSTRMIAGRKIPDCVSMILATNERKHKAGVGGILSPVKSRMHTIVELIPDLDDWRDWASRKGFSPTVIAFLGWKPELLCAFDPTADMTNCPLPRTWGHLCELEALGMPADIELIAFAGCVGEAAAHEYLTFRRMYKNLVNVQDIIDHPSTAAIPTKVDVLHATVAGLAGRADASTFKAVATYCKRLVDAKQGEHAAFCIQSATARDASLLYTDTYIRMQTTPLGQLVTGNAI